MPQTRSQRKRMLEAAARRIDVQVVRRVKDESDLYVFTVSATANPAVGTAVEHLTIEITDAYSSRLLRSALQISSNIQDLILTLPGLFPLRLLDGVVFNDLQLLKTNLPHNRLVTFLSAHQTLRFLDLGPCAGRSQRCPLTVVDLSRIHDIRCPVECFTTLVHLSSTRIRGDLTRPKMVVSTILHSFPIAFHAVYTLSLQFNPTDDDIIASIARYAPMVRVLRLWERADFTPLSPDDARPWQHATSLRDSLRKMRFLDHFVIRTTGSFVSSPTIAQERKTIFKWVGENTVSHKHPSLKFVAVWYRATKVGAGTLTQWRKGDDGVWSGVSVGSPTDDDLGVLV